MMLLAGANISDMLREIKVSGMNENNAEVKKSWLRRHPMKTLFLFLGIIIFVFIPALNYSGMCIPEGRWLSDEEKINKVVALILVHSKSTKNINFFLKNKQLEVAEFIRSNPNCCAINPDTGPYDLPPPSFFDRITGFNAAEPITVDFMAHYKDKNNKESESKVHTETLLTNCGAIRE